MTLKKEQNVWEINLTGRGKASGSLKMSWQKKEARKIDWGHIMEDWKGDCALY